MILSLIVILSACGPADRTKEDPVGEDGSAPMPGKEHTSVPAHSFPARSAVGNFDNLQVLARDIAKDDLLQIMKTFSRSLGVKCNFCHQTDADDYASDGKPEKGVARDMMQMVELISQDHFTWNDAPRATCYMCHHGRSKPELDFSDISTE